jgi:hypothetical protein
VRAPSEEARSFAGLAADLLYIALFALAGFAAVDAYAPPQDLPWKPLTLGQPLGLATAVKLQRIAADPGRCMAFLDREDVAFSPAPDRDDGGFCVVRHALRLGPQDLRLSPAAPMATCGLGAAVALWTRQSVQPAAREIFGQEVIQLDHFGTYACRRIYGRAEGRPSRHASAEALDVAGFRLADGRRISVLEDWRDPGAKGRFLRRVHDDGCRLFQVVLSPDYNAAHANHLHFDMSAYRLCR